MLWRMPPEPRTARIGSMFIHFHDSTELLRRERCWREPGVEIAQRARAERLLALFAAEGPVDRRAEAENELHRLGGRRRPPPREVVPQQPPPRRRRRGDRRASPAPRRRQRAAREA